MADIVGLLQQNNQGVMKHSQSCTFWATLEFDIETRIGVSSFLEYRFSERTLCTRTYVIIVAGNGPPHIYREFVRSSLAVGIGFWQADELCVSAAFHVPEASRKQRSSPKGANLVKVAFYNEPSCSRGDSICVPKERLAGWRRFLTDTSCSWERLVKKTLWT